jgi:hypothetical protein
MKSGSLNLLEPSGPVQASNRIILSFYKSNKIAVSSFLFSGSIIKEDKLLIYPLYNDKYLFLLLAAIS